MHVWLTEAWHVKMHKQNYKLSGAQYATSYILHFCHACLNLLLCDLAIAQCSSFVKHLLYITSMCFVAMLECSSLVSCCMLSAIMLLIIVLHHSCFACHLQTVNPFLVILISILPKSPHISSGILGLPSWCLVHLFLPDPTYALHITSRISCHVLHHVACAFLVVDCGSVCLCSFLG